MLKSIILAATLATMGGLSLQSAMADVSARGPQGEHVPMTSITAQATEASIHTGAACTASTESSCTPAADNDGGFRDRNDNARHMIENR